MRSPRWRRSTVQGLRVPGSVDDQDLEHGESAQARGERVPRQRPAEAEARELVRG
jgi:hypothetical protein